MKQPPKTEYRLFLLSLDCEWVELMIQLFMGEHGGNQNNIYAGLPKRRYINIIVIKGFGYIRENPILHN